MKIQVFGSGCPSCKKLHELAEKAVKEMEIEAKVEYVTDVQKIVELGLMQSPVLAVDGKPVIVGQVPKLDKIKEAISNVKNNKNCCCGKEGCCGGNCC